MRRAIATSPLALLAIAAAFALPGCGDSEDEPSATSEAQTTTSRPDAADDGAKDEGASRGGEGLPVEESEPIAAADLPEPVEGSKRAAPGVPTSKGGDNSIQTWGTEASAAEREEITATLQAFYDARAAAEWAKACSYLAADQKTTFSGLIRGRKSADAACAEAMGALAEGISPAAFDKEARIDYVLSARSGRRDIAFLIYTRPDSEKAYAGALGEEGGEWKVISVGPTVLN